MTVLQKSVFVKHLQKRLAQYSTILPLLLELLLLCESEDLEELEEEDEEELDDVVEEMDDDLLLLRFRFLFSLS